MRLSKLKLAGLIALMLVMCTPSFGEIVSDNLGATIAGTSGTGYGSIALAQRFFVSDANVVDYTWSENLLDSGWITGYGTANMMQIAQGASNLTSVTLALFNDLDGDADTPTVSIFTDTYNSAFFQPEPGFSLGTLTIDPAFVPFPTTLSHALFTTSSVNLVDGASYWIVLTSPGPNLADPASLGAETEWAYTSAPEPSTLVLMGGVLVLLGVWRKRL